MLVNGIAERGLGRVGQKTRHVRRRSRALDLVLAVVAVLEHLVLVTQARNIRRILARRHDRPVLVAIGQQLGLRVVQADGAAHALPLDEQDFGKARTRIEKARAEHEIGIARQLTRSFAVALGANLLH